MKNMNNANLSSSKELGKDLFAKLVEAVFIFIHENYGEFGAVLKGYQINYSQYAALVAIYMYGGLSEGELAKMLFINPSTVSRMVYALGEKGWVKSTRDKADRRKVMVALSPAGKRRMEGMQNKQAEVLARQVENLDKEKRDYVYRVAEFVNQALRYMTIRETKGTKDNNK